MFSVKEKLCLLKNGAKYFCILLSIYLIGFFVGVFFKEKCFIPNVYQTVCDYYCRVLDANSSLFGFFFSRVAVLIPFFLIIFALSLNKFSAAFSAFVFFYRGMILGGAASLFAEMYFVSGGVVYLFAVFPQNVVATLGAIALLVLNGKKFELPIKRKTKYMLENAAFSFAVCLIGVVYEFLVLALVIRPLSLYF